MIYTEEIQKLKAFRKEYKRGESMSSNDDGDETPRQVKNKALEGMLKIIKEL